MAVGWDGRAAFAELRLSHIAVSSKAFKAARFKSLLSLRPGADPRTTVRRVRSFRTSPIVPELPAPDLLINLENMPGPAVAARPAPT
eukprot:375515-Hanusia_phi.AAC.1